jgi:hypothetical protein
MSPVAWLAPHAVGLVIFVAAFTRGGGFDSLALLIGLAIVYHGARLVSYLRARSALPLNVAAGQRLALILSAPFLVGLPVALAMLLLTQGPGLFRSVGGLLLLAVPVLSWGGGLLLGLLGNQLGRLLVREWAAPPSDAKPGA